MRHLILISLLSACSWVDESELQGVLDQDGDGVLAERFGGEDCVDNNSEISNCDQDNDGERSIAAGGDDCDDQNPAVYSTATEICDGIDNNCNEAVDEDDLDLMGNVKYLIDQDDDGFGTEAAFEMHCSGYEGEHLVVEGGLIDCEDEMPFINPGMPESCGDGVDNNCSGEEDELGAVGSVPFWPDTDDDGWGDPTAAPTLRCLASEGWVANSADCDDKQQSVRPTPFWPDNDGDGYGDKFALLVMSCDSPDGFVGNANDCADTSPERHDFALEVCDGADNDCDGLIDDDDDTIATADDVPQSPELAATLFFQDADNDGLGDAAHPARFCVSAPAGFVSNSDDCSDSDAAAGQVTLWLEDTDGDGFGAGTGVMACSAPEANPNPFVSNTAEDCAPADSRYFPGAWVGCASDLQATSCDLEPSNVLSLSAETTNGWTLKAALDSVCDSATIELGPGHWNTESIEISSEVVLRSADSDSKAALFSDQGPVATVSGPDAHLTLENLVISESNEGLIITNEARFVANDVVFDHVVSSGDRAALVVSDFAEAQLSDSLFTGNDAKLGSAVLAENFALVEATAVDFSSNGAFDGSQCHAQQTSFGTVVVQQNSTFFGNRVSLSNNCALQAGGLYASGSSTVELERATFSSNTVSRFGGAIVAAGGTEVSLVAGLLQENSAAERGGAIYADRGDLTISDSTFSRNVSPTGAGVYITDGDFLGDGVTFVCNSGSALVPVAEGSTTDDCERLSMDSPGVGTAIYSDWAFSTLTRANFIKNDPFPRLVDDTTFEVTAVTGTGSEIIAGTVIETERNSWVDLQQSRVVLNGGGIRSRGSDWWIGGTQILANHVTPDLYDAGSATDVDAVVHFSDGQLTTESTVFVGHNAPAIFAGELNYEQDEWAHPWQTSFIDNNTDQLVVYQHELLGDCDVGEACDMSGAQWFSAPWIWFVGLQPTDLTGAYGLPQEAHGEHPNKVVLTDDEEERVQVASTLSDHPFNTYYPTLNPMRWSFGPSSARIIEYRDNGGAAIDGYYQEGHFGGLYGLLPRWSEDLDEDGLSDRWEELYFGDEIRESGTDDHDGDGVSNLDEFTAGTNPLFTDTDEDGVPDGADAQPLNRGIQ